MQDTKREPKSGKFRSAWCALMVRAESRAAQAVCLALFSLSDASGVCAAPREELAQAAGLSEGDCATALEELGPHLQCGMTGGIQLQPDRETLEAMRAERRRAAGAARQRRYRERQRSSQLPLLLPASQEYSGDASLSTRADSDIKPQEPKPPVKAMRDRSPPMPDPSPTEPPQYPVPKTLQEALRIPLVHRLDLTRRFEYQVFGYCQPEKWPEVKQVADAFFEAAGLPPLLPNRWSKSVVSVLSLYDGNVDLATRAAAITANGDFVKKSTRPGVQMLTDNTVTIAVSAWVKTEWEPDNHRRYQRMKMVRATLGCDHDRAEAAMKSMTKKGISNLWSWRETHQDMIDQIEAHQARCAAGAAK